MLRKILQLVSLFSICFIFLFCHQHKKDRLYNNKINIRLVSDPDQINPILSRTATAGQIEQHIFYPLLEVDPNSLSLQPKLAQNLPTDTTYISSTGKQQTAYTFNIHSEASWDNGQAVTARDYLFTLKLIFNPHINSHGLRSHLSLISEVQLDSINPKWFRVITEKYRFSKFE